MLKKVLALRNFVIVFFFFCVFLTEKHCAIFFIFFNTTRWWKNSSGGGGVTQVVSTVVEKRANQEEDISSAKGPLLTHLLQTDHRLRCWILWCHFIWNNVIPFYLHTEKKKYLSIWEKTFLVHLRLRVIGKGNGSEICHITVTTNGKRVFQFTTQYEKAKGNLPISMFFMRASRNIPARS